MLAELRDSIVTDLTAAGIKSVDYTSDALLPPIAAVVPGQPYLTPNGSETTFAEPYTANFDVLLLVAELGSSKKEADLIDEQIEKAVVAIRTDRNRRITRITRPGVLHIERAGDFTGVVIQLEQNTTEPKPTEET